MKTIRTKVYQFSELSKEAQFAALLDQIKFEIETMTEDSPFYPAAIHMEKNQTPWFLGEEMYHNPDYRKILIDTIEINDYHFTKDGKLFHS